MVLKTLLTQIWYGEESSGECKSSWNRVAVSEQGLISWATLLAVFLFCALIAIVFNVGRIANDKLEAQIAADSVAYSSSLVQARSMNAITASNHMIGELMTLYTMHHAIGGKLLDEGKRNPSASVVTLNAGLIAGYAYSMYSWPFSLVEPRAWANMPLDFSGVFNVPRGEATVHDAKCLLKWKYIEEYLKHSAGSWRINRGFFVRMFPPTFAKGQAMIESGLASQRRALSEMRAINREYAFIDKLESFAIGTKQIKKQVVPALVQALWNYEKLIVGQMPGLSARWKSMDAAKNMADRNDCVGEVLGRPSPANMALARVGIPSSSLPLVPDPWKQERPDPSMWLPEHSQLMRATYPWLQEWRFPLIVAFDSVAFRSRAARFYEYYTDRYVREQIKEFRDERGVKLMVIVDLDASKPETDKGTEYWRERQGSSYADRLFAVVGLARRKAPPEASHLAFFPNTNPDPIASMAQAIIYNGGRPEKWKRKRSDFISRFLERKPQPVYGWDTLNWNQGATEWKLGKRYLHPFGDQLRWVGGRLTFMDVFSPPDIRVPFTEIGVPRPEIKLNWQSKLVPVAPQNLLLRIPMIRDEEIRDRMTKQVLPGILANELGAGVINQ